MNRSTRLSLSIILIIGILFFVMPLAISLPSKGSAGQGMLDSFHPLMQPPAIHEAANYYYKNFVIPGVLIVLLAESALLYGRESEA